MDFLDDLIMYEQSMENAYNLITGRKTLDDIYYELEAGEIATFPLPFDPLLEDGRSPDVIDVLIEYFIDTEEYEKCQELTDIKATCIKGHLQIPID